ncbi:MAG: ATPase, partial [Candidatus Eremiobacteraeota bacterium]|nr:ATPase [Candidatus Eremiobacteraeota bacterium]
MCSATRSSVMDADAEAETRLNITSAYAESNIKEVLDKLDRELVGLAPVKDRIREIAAL